MISKELLIEGYCISGYVMRNDNGEVAIVEMGVIRRLSLDEMFKIMHPPANIQDDDLELAGMY